MVVFLSFSLTGWVGAPLVQMPQLSLSVGTWIESQCRTPSLTVYLSSRSSNQGSFLLIFTHAALSSSHKYRLSNISPACSLAWTWCLWWALRGNLCPSAAPQHCFCSTFIMRICVCVCVTVPGSQLSNVFLSVSSRCALSYQACQTLTFRRCLLLDSIARLPEPEGKRHFPSPSTSISQSRSRSAVSSCHLQHQPLPLGSMLDILDDWATQT